MSRVFGLLIRDTARVPHNEEIPYRCGQAARVCSALVRSVCARWRSVHDANLEQLEPSFLPGCEGSRSLARFPHLKMLSLRRVSYSEMAGGDAAGDVIRRACAACPELTQLDMCAGGSMESSDVQAMTKLTALQSLHLSRTNVDKRGVARLGALTSLTRLHLGDWHGLPTLRALSRLPSLTELDLSRCLRRRVNNGVVRELVQFPALSSLNLQCCETMDAEGFDALSRISGLAWLSLSCHALSHVSFDYLHHLSGLESLTSLELTSGQAVSQQHIRDWGNLATLYSLRLSESIASATMRDIGLYLTALTCLDLSQCRDVSVTGLEGLSRLSSLTSLNLSKCTGITDAALMSISCITTLQTLNLGFSGPYANDGICALAAKLSSLTSLNLALGGRKMMDETGCTSAGFEALSNLHSLTDLTLSFCSGLTNQGVRALCGLSALTNLDLSCCKKVSDECIWALCRISTLTSLDLSGCDKVSYSGVRGLSSLPMLIGLRLHISVPAMQEPELLYVDGSFPFHVQWE